MAMAEEADVEEQVDAEVEGDAGADHPRTDAAVPHEHAEGGFEGKRGPREQVRITGWSKSHWGATKRWRSSMRSDRAMAVPSCQVLPP
jgi:hypothetical protein